MAYLGILLIAAVNAVVVYFVAFLAVTGDGRADGVQAVWFIGFAWVAVATIVSWLLCLRGKPSAGLVLTAVTLPLGFVGALVAQVGMLTWGQLRPSRPEFELACRTVGATYLAAPSGPVESIAFDWDPGQFRPYLNHFYMDGKGNLSSRAYIRPRLPATIAFIESRRSDGRSSKQNTPYVREVGAQGPIDVAELTADTLVVYRTTRLDATPSEDRLTRVNVHVSDRRDGRALATLDYVVDEKRLRACGETSPGEMDETAFILRAVGARRR